MKSFGTVPYKKIFILKFRNFRKRFKGIISAKKFFAQKAIIISSPPNQRIFEDKSFFKISFLFRECRDEFLKTIANIV